MKTQTSHRAATLTVAGLLGLGACAACCLPLLLPALAGLGFYLADVEWSGWLLILLAIASAWAVAFAVWRRRSLRCVVPEQSTGCVCQDRCKA